ncbi:unnamed protein product, partial [Prorocentrum cordatum]
MPAWAKDASAALHLSLAGRRVPHLKSLGKLAPWQDQENEGIRVHAGTDGASAVANAVRFIVHWAAPNGLFGGGNFYNFRACTRGAVTHLLRTNRGTSGVAQFDGVMSGCLQELVGASLDTAVQLCADQPDVLEADAVAKRLEEMVGDLVQLARGSPDSSAAHVSYGPVLARALLKLVSRCMDRLEFRPLRTALRALAASLCAAPTAAE